MSFLLKMKNSFYNFAHRVKKQHEITILNNVFE